MSRGFVLTLLAIVIVGVALGGAFGAGVVYGRSSAPQTTAASSGGPEAGQFEQFRQRFQATPGAGMGAGMGAGGLFGTVESIEGQTVIVKTQAGSVRVTVAKDTAIRKMVTGSLADLKAGENVTVMGERREDGSVAATSIQLLAPDDLPLRQRQGQ